MVALIHRDSPYRRTALALALAALGVVGEASCVSNPYYMAPEGDTESLTDPSGDASTSADPTDTTDGTTDATTGVTTGMTTGMTTGDPGTVTDATSTTGVSTTEPVTSSTTDPDESESEGECQATEITAITIENDAFFVHSDQTKCVFSPWADNLDYACGYLNFGATAKAPLVDNLALRSSLGLRPPLDAVQEHLKSGALIKGWIELTVSGNVAKETNFRVGMIFPLETWSPGNLDGEIPQEGESTYRNRMGNIQWVGDNGPVGASQSLFCGAILAPGNHTNKTLRLCELGLGFTEYLQGLAEIDPALFQGLVVYPSEGGGGTQLFAYASGSAYPAKIVLEICTD